MYRLPSPFNAKARNNAASAAGGGSTSTTCSCCVVTAGIACIATSAHFAGLPIAPPETISPAVADEVSAVEQTMPCSEAVDKDKVSRGVLGFFALPISLAAGAAAATIDFGMGIFVGIAIWITLFYRTYTERQFKGQSGVLAAIVGLLAMAAVTYIEISIWFNKF